MNNVNGGILDWVKLGVRYYADAKIAGLPDNIADAAEVMFTRGLARAGEEQQQGFIPETALPELARRRRYAACAEALVAAGLWSRADGGYQILRWADWQDALDALAKRRTSDADRQRRKRAAAAESTARSQAEVPTAVGNPPIASRDGNQSRDNPPMSRDVGQLSRDASRDVTPLEGEGEREGVKVGEESYPPRAREAPPPKCHKHLDDPNPPPCGPCGDARKARNRWEVERGQRDRATPECPRHRGQPAHNCAGCRSEQIGVDE